MRKNEPQLRELASLFWRTWRALLTPSLRQLLPLVLTLTLQSILTLAIAFPLSTPRYSVDILEDFFYVAFGCSMLLATLLTHHDGHGNVSWPSLELTPVSSSTLVLAKFSATLLTCALVELLTLPIPLLLLITGHISAGHILAGYLGLLLVQAATLSIALFFATLTSRKLLAITLTCATLIAALIPWMLAGLLPPPLSELIVAASFFEGNFHGFMTGRLILSEVTYYASITCFMVVAAISTMRARRLL